MTPPDRTDDALMRLRHGTDADRARLAALAAEDPALRESLAEWDRQDAALRALYDPVARERVPERHLDVLARAERRGRRGPAPWARIAAAVALLALGAAGGVAGSRLLGGADHGPMLASAAFRAYATYSVESRHPVEVAASEEPHLTNWLSNRLGERIVLPDLSKRGFSLMGGRVVPDANGPAVLLMYSDAEQRRLVLYVAPGPGMAESTFKFAQRDAMRGFWWFDENLGCALVGDLTRDRLHDIAVDAYEQITGT
ncbi:anti-sigma factor [Salipiger sp. H15]|uniref:Anti-sigma factor n=1 Tax=Alloyangia sp. H15 TaxID=3029062 RepID=A0AAU8AMG4_9RHOB